MDNELLDLHIYKTIGKVVICGDSGTGKTSLFNKMTHKPFNDILPATIGVDFDSLNIPLNHKAIPLRDIIINPNGNTPINAVSPGIGQGQGLGISQSQGQETGIIHLRETVKTSNGSGSETALGPAQTAFLEELEKERQINQANERINNQVALSKFGSNQNIASLLRTTNTKIIVNKIEFHKKLVAQVKTKEMSIKLQIWDAAGQDQFKTIVKGYFRNASVIILVFDLCDARSFYNLDTWIKLVYGSFNFTDGFPLFFLVGNKSDIESKQYGLHDIKPIPQEKIDNFCEKYNVISYHRLSAKTDDLNITRFVDTIGHELYYHFEAVLGDNLLYEANQVNIINDLTIQRKARCCLLL